MDEDDELYNQNSYDQDGFDEADLNDSVGQDYENTERRVAQGMRNTAQRAGNLAGRGANYAKQKAQKFAGEKLNKLRPVRKAQAIKRELQQGQKTIKRGVSNVQKGEMQKRAGKNLKKQGEKVAAAGKAMAGTAIGSIAGAALAAAGAKMAKTGANFEEKGIKNLKSGHNQIAEGTNRLRNAPFADPDKPSNSDSSDSGDGDSETPGVPNAGRVIKDTIKNQLAKLGNIFKLFLRKYWFIILIPLLFLILFVIFTSSSKKDRGKYVEGDNSNVPYVVKSQIFDAVTIVDNGKGKFVYGFKDDEGNILTLDEAIDNVLTTLRENDADSALDDLGKNDVERKKMIKAMVMAEFATQYPDLTAKGDTDKEYEQDNFGPNSTATVSVDELSLDEKIYQMIMLGVKVSNASKFSDTQVGGYFLMGGSNYSNLTALGSNYKIAPFVATDDEGGQITRAATNTPSAKSYGDSQDYDQLSSDEIYKSNLLLEKGINVNLGPVADVTGSGTMYRMERSYSSDAEIVKECIKTVIGARNSTSVNGVRLSSTLKHYPGYPEDTTNTDYGTVVDNRSVAEINKNIDVFKNGISSGAQSVMISNVIYSNLDSNNPASLSPTIISGLRSGFNGVIMTDDLDAAATKSDVNRYKHAIQAGNDIVLLDEANLSVAFNQIKSAVESGEISEEQINQSVQRILNWKASVGIMSDSIQNQDSNQIISEIEEYLDDESEETEEVSNSADGDINGKIKIQRMDEDGHTNTLTYIDPQAYDIMLSTKDSRVMNYYTLKKGVSVSYSTGDPNYSGSGTEEIIWNYLTSRGLSEVCTAAIIGNLKAESNLNPGVVEGNGVGFGIAQWSFGRRTQIETYAASQGKSAADLPTQLDFLWMETDPNADKTYANLQWGGEGYGWNGPALYARFIAMNDINEAATMFCWAHERPDPYYAHLDNRIKYANEIYSAFAGRSTNTTNQDDSDSEDDEEESTTTQTVDQEEVTSKSLDNFLFIGDSRYSSAGSQIISLGNNITNSGISSARIDEWLNVANNNGTGTVQTTSVDIKGNYSGISIELGANSVYGNVEKSVSDMEGFLNKLKELHPNTPIYVNSCLSVNSNASASYSWDITKMKDDIKSFNQQISDFCNTNSNLYYIDISDGLEDENGFLKTEYSDDGLHLNSSGASVFATNVKKGILGAGTEINSETSNNSKYSTSTYGLVVASRTETNTYVANNYTYSHTFGRDKNSGATYNNLSQRTATPGTSAVTNITTLSYTSTNVDYQAALRDYTLYFDFLWAVLVESAGNQTLIQDWADLGIKSNVLITVYSENNVNISTSTRNVAPYYHTVLNTAESMAVYDVFNVQEATTTTINTIASKAAVTKANTWLVTYKNNAKTYAEYKSKEKEKVTEKTNPNEYGNNISKLLLRDRFALKELIEGADRVEYMIEDNPKVSFMIDIYNYVLETARGTNTEKTIEDVVDINAFNLANFVKKSSFSANGGIGGEITEFEGDGYTTTFTTGNMTFKEYKQFRGSYAGKPVPVYGRTVSAIGCYITSVTVIASGYGIDMNPGQVIDFYNQHGYGDNHVAAISDLIDKNCYWQDTNVQQTIIDQLQAGKPCMVTTRFYSSDHCLCVLGINDNNEVYVSDVGCDYPGNDRNGWQPIDKFLNRFYRVLIIE